MAQNVIYWRYGSNTLTIRNSSGSTFRVWNISDINDPGDVPWHQYRDYITSVTIGTGIDVTTMKYWFTECTNLTSITNFSYISNVTNMAYCFSGCTAFNQAITIPSSVTSMSYCFNGDVNFDSTVTFQSPSSVTNMSDCFRGCSKFNKAITIPSNVTNMAYCFRGCYKFNQAITIPSSVTNMAYCFNDCTAFNQAITIPSSVTNMAYCFMGCTDFDSTVTFQSPSNVNSMLGCFRECSKFNKAITIPSSVTNMQQCFYSCSKFNQAITIPSSVINMSYCFNGDTNFDSTVTFQAPSNVTNMAYCFSGCSEFKQAITIPSSVISMSYCFYGCSEFNRAITIPSSVTNMSYCFYGCSEFNRAITIPSSVTNMSYCFRGCSKFNQSITIPSSVTTMSYCFYSCTAFNQDILIPSSVSNISYCFYDCTSLNSIISVCTNIQNSNYYNLFKNTTKKIKLVAYPGQTVPTSVLYDIANTSSNNNILVGSLSLTISAIRDQEISSTVTITADLTRGDGISDEEVNIDICNNLSKDSARSDVLWYDNPNYTGTSLSNLIMSSENMTFYGIIEGINNDSSFSLYAIAYSDYSETSFQEMRIPSDYYTMDLLAGGKEIAFGVRASADDVYSRVTSTSGTPFTQERFVSNDTSIDFNKIYYTRNGSSRPYSYSPVDLSQYTDPDAVNPSTAPWYDTLQESEFYIKTSNQTYSRLNSVPSNWDSLPVNQKLISTTNGGFNYTGIGSDISRSAGNWLIQLGVVVSGGSSSDILWVTQFDSNISKTIRNMKVLSIEGSSVPYVVTLDYAFDGNLICTKYNNGFNTSVNWYIKYSPSYYILNSTKGLFKCGMDMIFRSKQSPEIFTSMYDLMYPIGSCYTTSTNTSPKTWLGGEWALINKQFIPQIVNLTNTSNLWTSYTKAERSLYAVYNGNNLELRVLWHTNTALSDVARNIFKLPWTTLGLSAVEHQIYTQINNDGGNAIGLAYFGNYTYYDSSGNAGTTDSNQAGLATYDWVTRAASYPTGTDNAVAGSFTVTCRPQVMLDSFCNQFIWKRIA